ncbi:26S proteasome non-ATPase regulatory subunit 10-like protein [Cricetulus griseus]|nr:26S proteasome non-ATPase regulatory subunit 10-like protein [Cricetulus griseus]
MFYKIKQKALKPKRTKNKNNKRNKNKTKISTQGSYEAMYCLLTISDQKYELTLDGSDIGFVSNSAAPIQQAPIVPSTEKGDFLNGIMSLASKNRHEIAVMFLEGGANPDAKDHFEAKAMHWAAAKDT